MGATDQKVGQRAEAAAEMRNCRNTSPVAQWTERLPSKQRVAGSNPAGDALAYLFCHTADDLRGEMSPFRIRRGAMTVLVTLVVAACAGTTSNSHSPIATLAPRPVATASVAATTASPKVEPTNAPVASAPTTAATPSSTSSRLPSTPTPSLGPTPTVTVVPTASDIVPTPAPQPTPARSPDPVSLQWTRLDDTDVPAVGTIYEVTPGQNRFLANASGGLMASPDGVHWSILGSAPPGRVYDDPRGLFAFRSGQTVEGSKAELWWSADGSSWKSLTDQPAFTSGPCLATRNPIGGIYPIDNALVAVDSAAAYGSVADGQTWNCLGPIPNLRINGGHDLLVGSGGIDPQSANYLWLSQDGATWRQTTETSDFMVSGAGGRRLRGSRSVVPGGTGFPTHVP